MGSRFLSPLRVEELTPTSGRFWETSRFKLLEPLAAEVVGFNDTVVVPVGFVTDFASVPRLPLAYFLAGGVGDSAAVVHDWLYYVQMTTRREADRALYELLRARLVHMWRAYAMWLAVRLFGWTCWRRRDK